MDGNCRVCTEATMEGLFVLQTVCVCVKGWWGVNGVQSKSDDLFYVCRGLCV